LRGLLPTFAIALLAALPAQAEIAVLANGMTFKVASHRLEDEGYVLSLRDGGEVTLPLEQVRGVVPDEVVEEVVAAVAAAPAGTDVRTLVADTARKHGLDPDLVLALVAVESGFRPDAVSPKGARGLMQLMPGTAAELGVTDAFDPAQNVEGGIRYLKRLIDLYDGDLRKALAAYNAGAGAVARHGGVPPYKETREYVERVMRRSRKKP
jgi:soluble lytic murein transglycosylase-like protein